MPAGWETELLPVLVAFEMLLAVGRITDRFTYPVSMWPTLMLVAIIVGCFQVPTAEDVTAWG